VPLPSLGGGKGRPPYADPCLPSSSTSSSPSPPGRNIPPEEVGGPALTCLPLPLGGLPRWYRREFLQAEGEWEASEALLLPRGSGRRSLHALILQEVPHLALCTSPWEGGACTQPASCCLRPTSQETHGGAQEGGGLLPAWEGPASQEEGGDLTLTLTGEPACSPHPRRREEYTHLEFSTAMPGGGTPGGEEILPACLLHAPLFMLTLSLYYLSGGTATLVHCLFLEEEALPP